MNPIQLFQLLEELVTLYGELKKDGTVDKLIAAEQAVQHEVLNNPKLKDLETKVAALIAHQSGK